MVLRRVSKFIDYFLPIEKWFYAAFLFTKYYAYIKRAPYQGFDPSTYLNHGFHLESLLSLLTQHNKSFSIPIKASNIELLYKSRPNGLILCSVHIPLYFGWLSYLIDRNLEPKAVIANHPDSDGNWSVLGQIKKIPALRPDPDVLVKIKSILRQGGTVGILIDNTVDGSYKTNIFRLAEILHSEIIYPLTKLHPDGYIEVVFIESPSCDRLTQEESVNQKANALRAHVDQLLR